MRIKQNERYEISKTENSFSVGGRNSQAQVHHSQCDEENLTWPTVLALWGCEETADAGEMFHVLQRGHW